MQPQRTSPPPQPLRRQDPRGFAFEKAAGLEQRQHLGHQGFGQRALRPGRHVLRQAFWLPGEAVAQAAYNLSRCGRGCAAQAGCA